MPDDVGLENTCGVEKVIGHANQKVNLCLEMINSRVATWMIGQPITCATRSMGRRSVPADFLGADEDSFRRVPRAIMQGDIITRIRSIHSYIGHYHVAGVPGRHEIDDTQEINYPPIMRAIAATGYTGYVWPGVHPTRDVRSSRSARRCGSATFPPTFARHGKIR